MANCVACHARDGRGGVLPEGSPVDEDGEPILREPARDALFTSFVQELGDEGRLPPTLDGVGDKCRPEFLQEVLTGGGRDRQQTMATRMPAWEPGLASEIAGLLALDPKPMDRCRRSRDSPQPRSPSRAGTSRARGRSAASSAIRLPVRKGRASA